MKTEREQKLVDLCFSLVYPQWNHMHPMKPEELMSWVADQLKQNGFPTTPVGSSWGVLEENKTDQTWANIMGVPNSLGVPEKMATMDGPGVEQQAPCNHIMQKTCHIRWLVDRQTGNPLLQQEEVCASCGYREWRYILGVMTPTAKG